MPTGHGRTLHDRAEVRGGGRKPTTKRNGFALARVHPHTNSPGGGVIFGPKPSLLCPWHEPQRSVRLALPYGPDQPGR